MPNSPLQGDTAVRVRHLAEAMARKANLATRDNIAVEFPTFHEAIYATAAQLLILPTSADPAFGRRWSEGLIREARSDLLLVCWPIGSVPEFAFANWRPGYIRWAYPLRLWMPSKDEMWLLAGQGAVGHPTAIRLGDRVHRQTEAPWSTPREVRDGYDRAAKWLARECDRASEQDQSRGSA